MLLTYLKPFHHTLSKNELLQWPPWPSVIWFPIPYLTSSLLTICSHGGLLAILPTKKAYSYSKLYSCYFSLVGTWAPKYLYDLISHLLHIFSAVFQTTLFKIATLYPYHSISFVFLLSTYYFLTCHFLPYFFYCLFPQFECKLINVDISLPSKTVCHIVSTHYTLVEKSK